LARLLIPSCVILALWAGIATAQPDHPETNYVARVVVTGSDERNRPLGLKMCFEDVLIKSSGDPSILDDDRIEALASNSRQFVVEFSYRDLLEGIPKHDDQGTRDRPFFLTCKFDPGKINGVLNLLGRKPWLANRPRLLMLLVVHGRRGNDILSSDGAFDADMRESLANAATRYGVVVTTPSVRVLQGEGITVETALGTSGSKLAEIAELSGSDVPLLGSLDWSDTIGWTATWDFDAGARRHRWAVAGVNYDEAFRNAVRGAAKVLSGNGEP